MSKTFQVVITLSNTDVDTLTRTYPHLLNSEAMERWVNELVDGELEFFEQEDDAKLDSTDD